MNIRTDYYKIVLVWLMGILCVEGLTAQEVDSLQISHMNSMRWYELCNEWLMSDNTAGITYNIGKGPGYVDLGYGISSGDYRTILEGENVDRWGLSTASYTRVGRINFYGSFTYKNETETGTRWRGMWHAMGNSPLVIGDSIGGDYDKEYYHLVGRMGSSSSNGRFRWGIGVDYGSGSGAKERDPRPRNYVMNMGVFPGVIYDFGAIKTGISLGFIHSKEEIDYTVENDQEHSFFQFRGMGFFHVFKEKKHFRQLKQNCYQGAFQLYIPVISGIRNLTQIQYESSKQEVEDGKNIVKNGGDYKQENLALKSVFTKEKAFSVQRLIFNAQMDEGDTWEYEQELKEVIQGKFQWVTFAQSRRFNRKDYVGSIDYEYNRIGISKNILWSVSCNGMVRNKKETFYNIPGIFTSEYTRLIVGGAGEKNFYCKNNVFALGAKVSYGHNLSAQEDIPYRSNNHKLFRELALQDFWYEADGYINWSVNAAWQFPLTYKRYHQNMYLKASFSQTQPQNGYWNGEKRNNMNITLGMAF